MMMTSVLYNRIIYGLLNEILMIYFSWRTLVESRTEAARPSIYLFIFSKSAEHHQSPVGKSLTMSRKSKQVNKHKVTNGLVLKQ